MKQALRGINLGGWLAAERWMTPQLFEGVRRDGEIALVRELGHEEARRRLEKHRSSFITEQDFAWIARHGFDFIRLPVGYWLFEETEDFIEGEHYLEQAFKWAERHGLSVVLDFHGLQGSQNGYDHSGDPGRIRLYRPWNRVASLRTLKYLCTTYGQRESLIGLEIANETQIRLGWYDWWRLLRYCNRAVGLSAGLLRPDIKIIVSDAFRPLQMARRLSKRGYDSRVVMDMHLYQMFGTKHQRMTFEEHIEEVEAEWRPLLTEVSSSMPVMVGEWSAALPAAAYRQAGIDKEAACVRYFNTQKKLFDTVSWAHAYWSYKAPSSGVWDSKKIISLAKKHSRD